MEERLARMPSTRVLAGDEEQLGDSDRQEDLQKIEDPAKVTQRVMAAYRRMFLRLTLMVNLTFIQKVERHWQRGTLGNRSDQEDPDHDQPKPRKSTTRRRRDDLTGVGEPIAPSEKSFPIWRRV